MKPEISRLLWRYCTRPIRLCVFFSRVILIKTLPRGVSVLGAYILVYVATYQSKPQIPIRHVVQTEIMQGGLYHPKPGWLKKNLKKTYSIWGTTTATFFVL